MSSRNKISSLLTPIKFIENRINGIKRKRKYEYWLYLCKCGKEVICQKHSVDMKSTLSCGCLTKINHSKLSTGQASFNFLYRNYVKKAISKNLEFKLTKNEFKNLINKNCEYCNIKPYRFYGKKNANGKIQYNGIDRIDNNIGYIDSNCTTCCFYCNNAKSNNNKDLFLNHILKIHKRDLKTNIVQNIHPPLFNILYTHQYKKQAEKRKLDFNLLEKDFKNLIQNFCYYCGDSPSTIYRRKDYKQTFLYNGIDRVDNTIGYLIDNCITCCKLCNKYKYTMTHSEFNQWVINIVNNLNLKDIK